MFEDDLTPAPTTPSDFSKNFNNVPDKDDISMTISAPGKIILFGEHSVVYDKLAVAASLGLRTKLLLTESEFKDDQSNYIKVDLHDINLTHVYDLKDIQHSLLNPILPLTKSASNYNWKKPKLINHAEILHRVVDFVTRSAGSFPLTHQQHLSLSSLFYLFTGIFISVDIDLKPFTIHIKTELSISSGSGSSASYSVAVAAAFIHYLRLIASKRKNGNVSKDGYKITKFLQTDLKRFNEEELGIISEWAYSSEKIMHGTPSGIDNAICTYGALVEFRRSTGAKLLKFHNKLQLLLINTNVKRNTKKLVADVAVLKESFPAIVDPILEAMEKIVQKAIDCLLSLDDNYSHGQEVEKSFCVLGQLTDINQHLLQAIGVSHPTLDKICKIVKGFNLNAKLTGAGGGGYAIVLIPLHTSSTTIDQLTEKLITKGFGTVLVDLAGPGVTVDFCNMNFDYL